MVEQDVGSEPVSYLNLDALAAEIENRRGTWEEAGLYVGQLTWGDAAHLPPWLGRSRHRELGDERRLRIQRDTGPQC